MNMPQKPTTTQPITLVVPCPTQKSYGAYNATQQPSYISQNSYVAPQSTIAQGNPRAKRAMINGFISLALSLLTLITLAGFAGIFTGTLALIYGCMGLNRAMQLPDRSGRGQAIAGIVLGLAAWFMVIFSLIIRHAVHGGLDWAL